MGVLSKHSLSVEQSCIMHTEDSSLVFAFHIFVLNTCKQLYVEPLKQLHMFTNTSGTQDNSEMKCLHELQVV